MIVFDPPGGSRPDEAAVSRASDVKRRNSDRLFAIPDVVGHGIGLAEDGTLVIEVYLSRENVASRGQIPAMLEATPVRVKVKGPFLAR